MTTANATPIKNPVNNQVTEPTTDITTRLTLAAVAMNVLLDIAGGSALAQAHAAVVTAIAEADRYSASSAALAATVPKTFTSHRILRRAGDVIRSRGWHQGGLYGPGGAVCALAAIRIACGHETDAEDAAVNVLTDRIRHYGYGQHTVPCWNDSKGRTRADILRLLY